eukprot:4484530-Prymnesium_polylepis.3
MPRTSLSRASSRTIVGRASAQSVASRVASALLQHGQKEATWKSLTRVADGRCCGRWPMLSPEA